MRRSSTSSSERTTRRSRIAVKALAALAVVAVAEVGLRVLPEFPPAGRWGDAEQDLKAARLEELAGGRRLDVVVVGSSVADAAIDPAVVEERSRRVERSYNAALEGSSAGATGAWLRSFVVPEVRPRVALVVIGPRELNERGTNQRAFDRTFFGSPGWREADGRATVPDRLDAFGSRHSALIRSRHLLRDPVDAARWLRGRETGGGDVPIDEQTGRLVRHDEARYHGFDDLVGSTSFVDFTVGGRSLARLRRELAAVQRSGTEVVVVAPPRVSTELVRLVGATRLDRADRTVSSVAAELCAPFFDLRELVGVDGFGDPLHVNRAGSATVSDELARRLDALPDGAWSPSDRHGCDDDG